MARTKQATPVRREPSSEYTGSHDRVLKSRADLVNGDHGKTNGQPEAGKAAPSKKEAGLTTLVMDVAGIYASL
jgi:UDP-galactose transporter B1